MANTKTGQWKGSPYGTNDYQTYYYVSIPAGFHHKPAHINFLKEIGQLDGNTISDWVHFQQVYQGMMRSALRLPDDPKPVCVSVPDEYTARQQEELFPGCKLVSLGMDDWKLPKRGRPCKYATAEERK